MKRNHVMFFLVSVFAITLMGLGVFAGFGRMMIIYKQSVSQKSVLRGVESINVATQAVTDDFAYIIDKASHNKFDALKKVADDNSGKKIKQSELENYFRMGVINELRDSVGDKGELRNYLNEVIPQPVFGSIHIDDETDPYINVEKNADDMVIAASVKDVVFVYDGIPGITRREKVNFTINFPQAVFYSGNEEIFDYCMMSGKGIYASGATSSFVGNIYAGNHPATESREAEVAYGEVGAYGGLNFLSTQVGIEADRIVSMADINLNGSFVIFNPSTEAEIKCFGGKIRKIRGYNSDSIYSMNGQFFDIDEIPESEVVQYLQMRDAAETTILGIRDIPFYYDSNNDSTYDGEYRKIVSSEDVEITEDITGIIFTSGNVIINAGCNVEGLILSGDRIYLLGNNNIVSNASIAKNIISDEMLDDGSLDEDEKEVIIVDGEEQLVSSGVVYHALDYMGGLELPGLRTQNYLVVPYQE